MRYLMQFMVMLGDVMLFAGIGIVLYYGYTSVIVWALVILAFHVWKDSGAFDAWRPRMIRTFMRNAKKAGL